MEIRDIADTIEIIANAAPAPAEPAKRPREAHTVRLEDGPMGAVGLTAGRNTVARATGTEHEALADRLLSDAGTAAAIGGLAPLKAAAVGFELLADLAPGDPLEAAALTQLWALHRTAMRLAAYAGTLPAKDALEHSVAAVRAGHVFAEVLQALSSYRQTRRGDA